jgi:hypothetical protein
MPGLLLEPDHVRRINDVVRWYESRKGTLNANQRGLNRTPQILNPSALTPFELYDDITPGQSDKYAWRLHADLTRDEDADKVLVSDGILKSTRAFGTSHAGVTDGARGWYSTGPDGKNQIVSMEPLGTWIKAQASADAAAGYPVSLKNHAIIQPIGGILAEYPATAASVFSQEFDENDWVLVFWNESTASWGCFKPGISGGSNVDEKVKANYLDPTAGFLDEKLEGDGTWTGTAVNAVAHKVTVSHLALGEATGTATPSLKATVAPYNTTSQRITITPVAIARDAKRHVVSVDDATAITLDVTPTDVIGDAVWTSAAWDGAQRKVSHINNGTLSGSAHNVGVMSKSGTAFSVTPTGIGLDACKHVYAMVDGTAVSWDLADHLAGTTWITLASALGVISITHADASTATQTGPTPTIDLSGQTVTLSFTPETFDAKGHYKANGSAVTDTITLPIIDVDGSTWIDVSISTGTATVSHKAPDSTVSYAYSPASSLAVVSDGGTGYNLALTPHRLDFDSKGHEILTANTDETAVVAALTEITINEFQYTSGEFQYRTHSFWVLKDGTTGTWTQALDTTACP